MAWSALVGGTNSDYGQAVCVTTDGDPVIVGYTYSTDLPTSAFAARPVFLGGTIDSFVTRYKADGTLQMYCTYLGGSNSVDYAQGVAPGQLGTVYVTGYTYSTNFPLQNPWQPTKNTFTDGFVTKIAP